MATLIVNLSDLKNPNSKLRIQNIKGYFEEYEEGKDSLDLSKVDVILYREGTKDIIIKAPNKE